MARRWKALTERLHLPNDVSWKRLFAEGGAIVLSILLAFGIDASWEARGDRAQASRDLAALRTDFEAASLELERVTRLNQASLRASDSVLNLTQDGGAVVLPTVLLSGLTLAPTYDPPTGSVDALIASGRVSMLGDAELERALTSWPAALADLDRKGQLQESFVYEQLMPEMRRVVPTGVFASDPSELPQSVPVRPTDEFRALLAQLRIMVRRSQDSPQGVPKVEALLAEILDLLSTP